MDNARKIWRWFWERIGNDYGVAGLMGNLAAESNLRSNNLQNSYEKLLGMTDEEYTEAVDSGAYSKEQFVNDGAGYGLAQFTYPSRKEALWEYAHNYEVSIGDLNMQMEFIWQELGRSYKKVLHVLLNAKSVREASDAVMLDYERPADQSEENQAARGELGKMYYEKYAVQSTARKLTIYKRLFYSSDCLKSATKQTPTGVQVHSTGANNPWLKRYVQPDDGRIGVNTNKNDHNEPGGNVCASAYIGKQADGTVAVYQALPWDVRCWLSGSGSNGNANRLGYLGYEICEDGLNDRAYFDDAVMEKAVLLTAYWCQEFGINVEEYVRDHHELHDMGFASNHGDISHWLGKFGQTMGDFRARVKEAVKDGVNVTVIDCDDEKVLFRARAVNPGTYLNIRSGKGTMYASIGKIPQGEECDVLDDTDSAWWKVRYRGTVGYAMSKYLDRIPEDNDDNNEDIGNVGDITGDNGDSEGPTAPDIPGDENDNNVSGNPGTSKGFIIPEKLGLELFSILGAQIGEEAKMILDCRSELLINEDYR